MTSEALTSELNTGTHYTGSGSKRSKDAGPKSCVRLGQFWWWTSRAMMYRGDSDDWMSRCGARPCYHRWTISTSKVFPVVARQKSCCAWPEALNRTVISWIGWQHTQAYNSQPRNITETLASWSVLLKQNAITRNLITVTQNRLCRGCKHHATFFQQRMHVTF